jgi:hypothetical protein
MRERRERRDTLHEYRRLKCDDHFAYDGDESAEQLERRYDS